MPLFECTNRACGAVDNTAISEYWEQQRQFYLKNNRLEGFSPLCSECHGGRWHGVFPKKTVAERCMSGKLTTLGFLE